MIVSTNVLKQIILITGIAVFFVSCNKDSKADESDASKNIPSVSENIDPDCVEFVALWAAGDIAERIGKDKKWVFLNYTVDIWDDPPAENEGNIVGKLRASSYARIIEKKGDDYKVESPVNNIQGWISSEHVKAISWKNPKTKKLCK